MGSSPFPIPLIANPHPLQGLRIPRVNHGLIPIPPIANPPVLAGTRGGFGEINAPVLFKVGRQRELRDQVVSAE